MPRFLRRLHQKVAALFEKTTHVPDPGVGSSHPLTRAKNCRAGRKVPCRGSQGPSIPKQGKKLIKKLCKIKELSGCKKNGV